MGATDFQQAVDVNLVTYPFTVQNETCYYGQTTYLKTQCTLPYCKLCSVCSVKTVYTIHANYSCLEVTLHTMQPNGRFPQDILWIVWMVGFMALKYSCLTNSILSYLSKTSHYICFLPVNRDMCINWTYISNFSAEGLAVSESGNNNVFLLDGWPRNFLIPGRCRIFSLIPSTETSSGAYTASY